MEMITTKVKLAEIMIELGFTNLWIRHLEGERFSLFYSRTLTYDIACCLHTYAKVYFLKAHLLTYS
jgi:hypothetical protein